MTIINKQAIPLDADSYNRLHQVYVEQMHWKIQAQLESTQKARRAVSHGQHVY